MKTVGIIAEYNPFHNGHILQIQEVLRRFPDAGIVVVMSGSFTQRGSVAFLDKWHRAASAVRHGVSLVLELPTVFATRSAQYFAEGGVRLLDRLGVVDTLIFGSEYDDLSFLSNLAKKTDPSNQRDVFQKALHDGKPYAASLTGESEPDDAIRQPNVILAVEYLRALKRYNSSITPMPLPRFSAAHNDLALPSNETVHVASASAIRTALSKTDTYETAFRYIPPDMANACSDRPADTSRLFRSILTRLLTASPEELTSALGISEGLEYRIRRAAHTSHTYSELIASVSSKRYPQARIRRLLLHLLLGLSKDKARRLDEAGPLYARPLAFDERGRTILRRIKDKSLLPIVIKPSKFLSTISHTSPGYEMFSMDIHATALSSLTTDPVGTPAANADYLISPVYLPKK